MSFSSYVYFMSISSYVHFSCRHVFAWPTGLIPATPRRFFEENAYRLVKDALSDARIQATNLYYHQVKGQKMNKKLGSSSIYLAVDEYGQVSFALFHMYMLHLNRYLCFFVKVMVPWMSNRPETYAAWSSVWASEDLKKIRKSQVKSRLGAEPHLWWGQLHAKGTMPDKETN